MEDGNIILTDNCVMIGASQSEHLFYKECRPLFEYLRKNPVGVMTMEMRDSAENDVIRDVSSTPSDLKELNSNLNLLRVEEVDYSKVASYVPKVQDFYTNLQPLLRNYIRNSKREAQERLEMRLSNTPKMFRGCVRECYKTQVTKEFPPYASFVEKILLTKFFDHPPSIDDISLLAVGNCMREKYKNVIVASTDCHITSIKTKSGIVERFVPDLIEDNFQIRCEWPSLIPQLLKT